MSACNICARDDLAELEEFVVNNAEEFGRGDLSWRRTAIELGLPHATPLTTHMRKHYVPPSAAVEGAIQDQFTETVSALATELLEASKYAPAEVRPLYLVAVRNIQGLQETKPSQQNLTMALKAIHEITGMRVEQKLMIEYARGRFSEEALPAGGPELPVLDVESWEEARS